MTLFGRTWGLPPGSTGAGGKHNRTIIVYRRKAPLMEAHVNELVQRIAVVERK